LVYWLAPLVVLLVAMIPVALDWNHGARVSHLEMNGRPAVLEQPVTVGEAALAVKVPAVDGVLRSVVNGVVLDAHFSPASVVVNGRAARLDTLLPDGARVTVTSGTDSVESTATREVAIPFPGKQKVAHGLWVGGVDGAAIETYGARSNEVVERRVVRDPVPPTPLPWSRVTLSFDDGPDPRWTPQVLGILRQYHVRAVFCEVGRSARAWPDLARAVRDAGHILCDHTQTHPNLTTLSANDVVGQITEGATSIAAASGIHPTLFRPPYGASNLGVALAVARLGLKMFLWTVDPKDYNRPGADVITSRVVRAVRPGGVVLMHDGGGNRSQTVAALPQIITMLDDYGYVLNIAP
jgi:peptidoglycan/xylan/chitin deacetylase (PgdA/CDA1 family)